MANYRASNVIFVDTTDFVVEGPLHVTNVKYIGNTSGTATIRKGTTSGPILWEADGTADLDEDVPFFSSRGIAVQVTNGAKVYIYIK